MLYDGVLMPAQHLRTAIIDPMLVLRQDDTRKQTNSLFHIALDCPNCAFGHQRAVEPDSVDLSETRHIFILLLCKMEQTTYARRTVGDDGDDS